MIYVHYFSSKDSLVATLSLAVLLFILFCAVWYSKMWRRNSEFHEKYGTENETDTSTEMAWSKHGHHTTVPLRGKFDSFTCVFIAVRPVKFVTINT